MVIFLLSFSNLYAEVITLRSGKVIEGTITNFANGEITIETKQRQLTFPVKIIISIKKSDGVNCEDGSYYDQVSEAVNTLLIKSMNFSRSRSNVYPKNKVLVTVYIDSYSEDARKMLTFLDVHNVKYVFVNIDEDERGKEQYVNYNGIGFPLVVVEDKIIRGYKTSQVLQAIKYFNSK